MSGTRRHFIFGGAAAALAGCSRASLSTRGYAGPEVTRIVVLKDRRRMMLLHHDKVLRDYRIALGFQPKGHKRFEGDGRTPEGTYFIDRRNPESEFHLSLGISYPNPDDIAYAEAQGKSPGGDIFIHGRPKTRPTRPDWTWGCISVTNRQMDEVFAMVPTGTRIDILA